MTVQIREKKKSRSHAMTFRRVDMTTTLAGALKAWFSEHPGGQYTISSDGTNPLNIHVAHKAFKRALRNSKWGKVRGFHVLRHSFASNLAAGGVDGRIISEFMGHTTLEMRARYRHLMPRSGSELLSFLFHECRVVLTKENPPRRASCFLGGLC